MTFPRRFSVVKAAQSTGGVALGGTLAVTLSATLAACGQSGETNETAVTTEASTAATSSVAPVSAPSTFGPVTDPGLGATFHFQGTQPGAWGGTEVTVAITNNNDKPLSPEAIQQPTLSYNDGNGRQDAEPLEVSVPEGSDPIQVPLDLPLGAGATTNLTYTFDVARGNLWDASFTLGNVTWNGNLAV